MPEIDEASLRIGYIAIRSGFINFPELQWCLSLQAKAEKPGPLIGIMEKQGYLSTEDKAYLRMIEATAEKDTARFPMLSSGQLSLKAIATEYLDALNSLKPGGRLGKYQILSELGRGGMGIVWEVTASDDEEEGHHQALKVLGSGVKSNVKAIELFKKEATIMSQIRHRNIVQIYEIGRCGGLDFIAMELIEGESLKDIVKREESLPPRAALKLTRGVAEALSAIHAIGIFHRDLKPDNIMIDRRGRPVLMDFGLAAFDKIEVSGGKGAVGTPLFQPPEQAEVGGRWGAITPASDVYGLGATLYFLLTGQPPFTGQTREEIRHKIFTLEVESPSKVNREIPQEASAIVLRCLRKDQTKRYKNPAELVKAIDRYLIEQGPKKKGGARSSWANWFGLGGSGS